METFTLSFSRCWCVRAFGRNPLVRFSDRVEAAILVLVFATALFATPVAGAIGTAVYGTRAQLYAEQVKMRHTVAATTIVDSTLIVDQNAQVFPTEVGWRANDVEHVGSVDLAHAVEAGDQVDVWVDASGARVPAPTPTWRAGIDATFCGVAAWLTAMAGIVGLSLLVRSWLIHRGPHSPAALHVRRTAERKSR